MGQVSGVNSKKAAPIDNRLFAKCSLKEVTITILALAALASIALGTVWLCQPEISLLAPEPLMGMIAGGGGVLLILSLAICFSRKPTQAQAKDQSSVSSGVTGKGKVVAPAPSLFPSKMSLLSHFEAIGLVKELECNEYFLYKTPDGKVVFRSGAHAMAIIHFHKNGTIERTYPPRPEGSPVKHERDILKHVRKQNYREVSLETLIARKEARAFVVPSRGVSGNAKATNLEPSLFPPKESIRFLLDKEATELAKELKCKEYFLHKTVDEKIVCRSRHGTQIIHFRDNGDIDHTEPPLTAADASIKHERDVLKLFQENEYIPVSVEALTARKASKVQSQQMPTAAPQPPPSSAKTVSHAVMPLPGADEEEIITPINTRLNTSTLWLRTNKPPVYAPEMTVDQANLFCNQQLAQDEYFLFRTPDGNISKAQNSTQKWKCVGTVDNLLEARRAAQADGGREAYAKKNPNYEYRQPILYQAPPEMPKWRFSKEKVRPPILTGKQALFLRNEMMGCQTILCYNDKDLDEYCSMGWEGNIPVLFVGVDPDGIDVFIQRRYPNHKILYVVLE